MNFDEFFEQATGFKKPFPWQRELATRTQLFEAITAPTGSGKTEAVLLNWLWRRYFHPDEDERRGASRRLVIALPMRTLVEQTRSRIDEVLQRLISTGHLPRPVKTYPLMGGAADDSWVLEPGREAVLVGTIDMLLSRALNRGFGRRRPAWPIDFGLLNNDSLWVFDEIQLMDAAVSTSCQLEAFRERFSVVAPARTIWMSATLEPSWLETIDHQAPGEPRIAGITDSDRNGSLGQRLAAPKEIRRAEIDPNNSKAVAARVLEEHEALAPVRDAPHLTLCLSNTVARAADVYRALRKAIGDGSGIDLLLLHSRFRPADRESLMRRLCEPLGDGGRIVVSTQVVEAGIDLDAGALISELAPWPSLVQRAGRLNRTGERTSSASPLIWLDPPKETLENELAARPYELEALKTARAALADLDSASFSPDAITAYAQERGPAKLLGKRPLTLFLRAPDLIDLFDTDPTLDGDDPDVGRFIRIGEDLDVGVAWRDFKDDPNDPEQPFPIRDEVCPVPIWERKGLVALHPWRWSYSRRRWERTTSANDLMPGDLLLLPISAGGYDTEIGWTADKKDRGAAAVGIRQPEEPDSDAGDPESLLPGCWITLAEHTGHVVEDLEAILGALDLEPGSVEALRLAARVHDVGKAHPEFQKRLRHWADEDPDDALYAKAPERRRWRPPFSFRHELVSALLLLERGDRSRDLDLAAYLVAAHHGKFRLTPRLLPDDHKPDRVVCLGVAEGDQFPQIAIACEQFGPVTLDLSLLRMGDLEQTTWIERVLDLLDELGPFRLAYLEALLRVADQRASAREKEAPK